eukprot:757710-Hanusia_phi.AAC.3
MEQSSALVSSSRMPMKRSIMQIRECDPLRLNGGQSGDEESAVEDSGEKSTSCTRSGTAESLRESARIRAERAKKAGNPGRTSISRTVSRIFFSMTNKMGLTGSSTTVISEKSLWKGGCETQHHSEVVSLHLLVLPRLVHVLQDARHGALPLLPVLPWTHFPVQPTASLNPRKPGGGGGRGSFSSLRAKGANQMRLADLPPMPGG